MAVFVQNHISFSGSALTSGGRLSGASEAGLVERRFRSGLCISDSNCVQGGFRWQDN